MGVVSDAVAGFLIEPVTSPAFRKAGPEVRSRVESVTPTGIRGEVSSFPSCLVAVKGGGEVSSFPSLLLAIELGIVAVGSSSSE